MKQLTLIRGLPGSGKSTLAKSLASNHYGPYRAPIHLEADMYFYKNDGEYNFDSDKLEDAHNWCYLNARTGLLLDDHVIVSNTFTRLKELKPYVDLAKEFNAPLQIILCQGRFGSIHNVPVETMEKMMRRFAYDLTPLFEEKVLA